MYSKEDGMTGSNTTCPSPAKRWVDHIRWIATLALAGVFAYAGTSKMAAPWSFADSIADYHVFPERCINLIALSLPPLELLCGLALLWPPLRREAAAVILGLCGIFLMLLGQAWVRGISVDCGCFGEGDARVGAALWVPLARDVAIAAVAAWLYLRPDKEALIMQESKE